MSAVEGSERRFEEIRGKFLELQEQEFENRLKRLLELDKIRTVVVDPSANFLPTDSIEPFVIEAVEAYINGLYRSCVFACATAGHHLLTAALIQESQFDSKIANIITGFTFGPIIRLARASPRFQRIAEEAKWLNKARNIIAAHARHVSKNVEASTLEDLELQTALMVNSAKALLSLLDAKIKKTILEKWGMGYGGKTISYGEALGTPHTALTELVWADLESEIIPALAFKAYNVLYKMMEQLQVYVITKYHTRARYGSRP